MLQNYSKQVLITGSRGFIGLNLSAILGEMKGYEVLHFNRGDTIDELEELVSRADVIVHLAGINRSDKEDSFREVNIRLTEDLCELVKRKKEATGQATPIVLASSAQAGNGTVYGESKLAAEKAIQELMTHSGVPAAIFRLPGVFGKWCRPGYNSVVATFCHRIARGLPIRIDDRAAKLKLVHIDSVVNSLVKCIDRINLDDALFYSIEPVYVTTVGELADDIHEFHRNRKVNTVTSVGDGFERCLYSTYVSYLEVSQISQELSIKQDSRGSFVEILRTKYSGQFSYFTCKPGVTRGCHYHHTKTEKFLILKGNALFRFRNVVTNETKQFEVSEFDCKVVDTIPGWVHSITNIGEDEMTVWLWANEIFDSNNPDTYSGRL